MSHQPASVQSATPTETPPDQIYIRSWDDPANDRHGHDPRSVYVEQFWLGVLGPSTIWFLRHCRHELDCSPTGFVLDLGDTAGALGLGHNGGRNSPLTRSIARACRFGTARPAGAGQLEVRRRLPLLSGAQLRRLPPVVQRRHQLFVAPHQHGDRVARQRRARRLALGLIECGEAVDTAETQLGQWRFHPAIAAEAVRWAWDRHHGDDAAGPLSPRSAAANQP